MVTELTLSNIYKLLKIFSFEGKAGQTSLKELLPKLFSVPFFCPVNQLRSSIKRSCRANDNDWRLLYCTLLPVDKDSAYKSESNFTRQTLSKLSNHFQTKSFEESQQTSILVFLWTQHRRWDSRQSTQTYVLQKGLEKCPFSFRWCASVFWRESWPSALK